MKNPVEIHLYLSMVYSQSAWLLQFQGLPIQLWWATNNNGNSLCCLGDIWGISDQELVGNYSIFDTNIFI